MQDSGKPSIGGLKLKEMVDAYERRLIESALADADGNQRRAAAALGLLPTTLHEKMKRLGLLRRRPQIEETEQLHQRKAASRLLARCVGVRRGVLSAVGHANAGAVHDHDTPPFTRQCGESLHDEVEHLQEHTHRQTCARDAVSPRVFLGQRQTQRGAERLHARNSTAA